MRIVSGNEALVKAFLKVAGKSLETFRYFVKRDVAAALANHEATLVGVTDAGSPVAYGHLDRASDVVWLGICVAEGLTGGGYGTEMMQALVAKADEEKWNLNLAVDEGNKVARRLYERFGFVAVLTDKGMVFMQRKKFMADTMGSLIDKLATVNQKMFVNQELLYEIRRMSFEEFRVKYFANEDGAKKLWGVLKKACDLNVQRTTIISEVDEKVIEIVKAAVAGKDLDNGSFVQHQHKTY